MDNTDYSSVVGMFARRDDALNAVTALKQAGFGDSNIQVLDNQAGKSSAASAVASTLDTLRVTVPKGDVDYYTRGLQAGNTVVSVKTPSPRANQAADILNRFGALAPDRASTLTQSTAATQATRAGTDEAVIPLVEEEMEVGKRKTERDVRVYTHVVENPVEQQVQLHSERIIIDRRATDRPATQADLDMLKDAVIEILETREEPIVTKQAHVVGEVHVVRDASDRTETVRGSVRHTEVDSREYAGAKGGEAGYSRSASDDTDDDTDSTT